MAGRGRAPAGAPARGPPAGAPPAGEPSDAVGEGRLDAALDRLSRGRRRPQGLPARLGDVRRPRAGRPRAAGSRPPHRLAAAPVRCRPPSGPRRPSARRSRTCRSIFTRRRGACSGATPGRMARAPGRYLRALGLWLADLWRDPTPNRGRRFGQAGVLAAELPAGARHLHAHFLHTPASVARYAAAMTGLAYSLSGHAKDVWTTPDWELRAKLGDARFTVTCTAAAHARLDALAPGRVTLVYHGLDRHLFAPPATFGSRRDGTDPADPVRLLAVGRFQPKKGYPTLLEAVAQVRAAARLTVVGYGPLQAALHARAEALGAGRSRRVDRRAGPARRPGALPGERSPRCSPPRSRPTAIGTACRTSWWRRSRRGYPSSPRAPPPSPSWSSTASMDGSSRPGTRARWPPRYRGARAGSRCAAPDGRGRHRAGGRRAGTSTPAPTGCGNSSARSVPPPAARARAPRSRRACPHDGARLLHARQAPRRNGAVRATASSGAS